jgi:catechol 2,3-dioxygenase-like lactoylglutathione lyase family enzyme
MKFAYTGIEVKDMDQSIKFYTEGMRMSLVDRHLIHATGGEVASLQSEGSEQLLELNWYPDAEYRKGGSELDHLAFEVDDVDREIARLERLGARRARATEVRPRYVLGFVEDPNGIWIELFKERKQGHSERE